MKLTLFLEQLENNVPKIVYFCATHMLQKNYNIQDDDVKEEEIKTFFTHYNCYQTHLNDYAGVIYNKYDSSIDEVYESLCLYFNETPDNKSLFEYRLTRVINQDPSKYLNISDPEMRNAAILRAEDKISVIENSHYYLLNKKEAQAQISALKQSLDLIKRAVSTH
jgi:hypothetical protein